MNDLVLQWLPFAMQEAKRWLAGNTHFTTRDDLFQVASLALCVAAKTYDATKGEFSTYARRAVMTYCCRHLDECRACGFTPRRSARKRVTKARLDTPIAREESGAPEETQFWLLAKKVLPSRAYAILVLSVLQGKMDVEIAASLGLSKARVGQIRHEALNRLRGLLTHKLWMRILSMSPEENTGGTGHV